MTSGALEGVLQQFGAGDAAAAEQVFLAYAPYLCKVVRRLLPPHLRARFDSVDVVQSVWADLLDRLRGADWRFRDVNQLRAFLVLVTRNRFVDRARQHQAALARERAAPAGARASPPPGPCELAQARELWERMLALCPPAHREVLHLKRQGLGLEEIAARTGLHAGSIRRILRGLARRLTRPGPE
jgi:RNA polymerase sigma-70 factor (ECF subfamily)